MGSGHETPGSAELARLASVNLNLLVPLLALLEERSVSRAAARVGLSQPAMSHALRRMRRLLGDEVVVRRGSAMVLTPRAEELVAPLRGTLHQAARIVHPASFDPAVDHRVVTVAMTTSTAFVIGGQIARLVAERAPHVVLRVLTQNPTESTVFADHGVDVVLLSEAFASPFPRERLYDNRWVVIAGPGAPADADAVELLTTLPHVVVDGFPQSVRPYEVLDTHEVRYSVRNRVSDFLLVPHLVAGAGGVAVHGYRIAVAMSANLDLRIEEFPFPVPGLGVDMIWNPWLADDEFAGWLRAILVEAATALDERPDRGGLPSLGT